MHNLAIALSKKDDYEITGSDDEFFEPSLSRLREHGLLPKETGWYPEKITNHLSAVILGMHARADNPELIRAKELGIKIYSFPEYLYQQTRSKTLPYFISDRVLILEIVTELLYQERMKDSVRLLGISLSNLNTEQKKFVVVQLKFDF